MLENIHTVQEIRGAVTCEADKDQIEGEEKDQEGVVMETKG